MENSTPLNLGSPNSVCCSSLISFDSKQRLSSVRKVIILAAGIGQRLYPLTKSIPKCLLKVGGESILAKTLYSLEQAGISEVLLIAGHCAEALKSHIKSYKSISFKLLFNPFYAQYNNSYSLWLAGKHLCDGFILFNSDVIASSDLIHRVVNSQSTDFMVVDDRKVYEKEAMKVKREGKRIIAISKDLQPKDYDGEYIGIAKFSPEVGKQLYGELCHLAALNDGFSKFYEAAIDRLLARFPIAKFSTDSEPWIEIDDFTDLARAKKMYQDGHFEPMR
uniref:Phosphocholine cytidylyltransferase family protein n=1 Tax=candidate division WOR-3 bacterium TaxID=2052148 RepID=A0A7C6A9N0_UNCW3